MAGDAADPTELAGVAEMGTESVEAWSVGDVEDYPLTGSWEDPERRWTPRRITILAVAASVLVIATAAGVTVWNLRQGPEVHTTTVVVATATATATVIVAEPPKPPPPSTVTVTARPTAPTPSKVVAVDEVDPHDGEFIERMRNDGWYIVNPWLMTSQARKFCTLLRQGVDPTKMNQEIAAANGIDMGQALIFTSNAMLTYPGCRFGAGR